MREHDSTKRSSVALTTLLGSTLLTGCSGIDYQDELHLRRVGRILKAGEPELPDPPNLAVQQLERSLTALKNYHDSTTPATSTSTQTHYATHTTPPLPGTPTSTPAIHSNTPTTTAVVASPSHQTYHADSSVSYEPFLALPLLAAFAWRFYRSRR